MSSRQRCHNYLNDGNVSTETAHLHFHLCKNLRIDDIDLGAVEGFCIGGCEDFWTVGDCMK